ncbi:unnamed protein product [Adineta steineri]|uniref:NAD(P)(+)--arginine ADP-ribosyltransferase n=2 Tax=Adineta steineri TaxID=433720 RepID=A0A815I3A2_9BILA|nr:unnamed protein product [Adineta steineri]
MNNNNTTMTPFDAIQPRRRMVQNYTLLWLNECTGEANEDYQNISTQLKTITDNVNVFKQRDLCIDYLTDAHEDIKSFLVVKETMAQQIMPLINDIPQLHSIYIFNDTNILNEESIRKWQKVKSVHTNIDDLCQGLQLSIKQYHKDSIAMSFITAKEMASTDNLNQLEPSFMYTQIFKDILLDMEYDAQTIKQFTAYCRRLDNGSPKNIDEFEKKYDAQSAIWWYTSPSFIYSMLNYALRTMEGDTIINMGFFIHDLHQQILQLHQQQVDTYHGKSFIVYRGQGLSKPNFEKLQKTKGGLMSFNNFLSTSTEQYIPLGLARSASENTDMVGILFVMSVDPSVKSAPFASIKEISYFKDEEEILFSMHTVFRVGTVEKMDNNNQLYQVELQLTSDDDPQLRVLTDRIRKEADGDTGWKRLGNLLLKIGQFNKAEELYNVLLEQTSDEDEKQHYYNQLGGVHWNQGDYEKAIWYFEQKLKICLKTLSSNHPRLATPYNNIGIAYDKMGDYSKALSFHKKALEIFEKTLPSNHPVLATSYNNIGSVNTKMGEYSKALSFYEKSLIILQIILPSNHPDLATSYNNIAGVYTKMGEYAKALSFYEKALEIAEKTLPSNHPDLAASYNNIAGVCDHMGEYSKALSFHKKAFEIFEKILPPDHSSLTTLYNNIGLVYSNVGEYSKALSSLEKALEIQKRTLPSNHPHLVVSYDNIGTVYRKMKEDSKALSFYEKALEIAEKTLPSNHPSLATLYNNIGLVYSNMEEYSKAFLVYEKTLEIQKRTLSSNHPDLAATYNNIGMAYYNTGEYSKALSFLKEALEIFEKTLPSKHPSLATLYINLSSVYRNMGEHSKAISFFEKALEILHKTPPSNRSLLATL